jgi:hypothetical protein
MLSLFLTVLLSSLTLTPAVTPILSLRLQAQYIAEMTGQDGNKSDVIRSIGENMALNNGAYAMSGESIKSLAH